MEYPVARSEWVCGLPNDPDYNCPRSRKIHHCGSNRVFRKPQQTSNCLRGSLTIMISTSKVVIRQAGAVGGDEIYLRVYLVF